MNTILLVEADPTSAQLIRSLLQRPGAEEFEIHHAEQLSVALESVHDAAPDLILLDLLLPDSDGLDALRKMRAAAPNTPIVVLTNLNDQALGLQAVEAGAQDYLIKTRLDHTRFIRIVRYAIERQHVLTGLAAQRDLARHEAAERKQAQEGLQAQLDELSAANERLRQQNQELQITHPAIETARRHYLELFDFAPDGYLVTSPNGIIQEANRAAHRLLQADRDWLVGKPLALFVAEADHPALLPQLTEWQKPGTPPDQAELALSLRPRDGPLFPAALTISLAYDPEGQLTGLRWLLRDMTQHQQTQAALSVSETRYRRLFEAAQDGVLLVDAHTGQITDVNPFLVDLLGYSHAEFTGGKLWEVGPLKDLAASHTAFQELQAKDYIRYEDLPLETKDGRRIDVEFVSNVYAVDHTQVIQCNIRDITARVRAEAALRRERDQAQLYLDVAGVLMVALDSQGCIEMINKKGSDILGYPAADLLGRNWFDLCLPPGHRAEARAVFGRLMAGETEALEYQENAVVTRSGSLHVLAFHNTALHNPAGQIIGTLSSGEDVTERHQAEVALAQEQSLVNALMTSIPDKIYFKDRASRFLRANQAEAAYFGLSSPADLVGKTDFDFFAEDHARQAFADEQAILDSGQPLVNIEEKEALPDGRVTWASTTKMPLRGSDGRILGTCGISRDITERKQAETRLENQHSILQGILRSTSDLVFSLDPDYRYTSFNPAHAARMQALYGVDIRVGQSLLDYITVPEDRDKLQKNIDRALQGERLTEESYAEDERLGRVDLEVSHNPIHDEAGRVMGVAVFSRDISAHRRAERALLEERSLLAERVVSRTAELSARTAELSLANAALNRAARMKDEFLAGMSHELRTPLTGILGLSETLEMGIYGALTDKQKEILRIIYASGHHLLDLINDILDLSKVEAGKVELQLERMSVEEVCLASMQFVKQSAQKKNLRLATSLDTQVTTIRADARRLKQMLVNLLGNAVKFTPEGGEVGLKVEGDAVQQVVRFTVWDTGIGIAQADMAQLFQPFVQLDNRLSREYSGTGLGLSLVLRMAELHGGSVAVESEGVPGQGSRFIITLPWPETDPLAAVSRRDPLADPPLPLHRAITVEDTAIAAEQLTRYLTELGFTNTVLPCGAGTLEKVLEVCPDVILLDILLPDVSGWEVLRQLKADPRTGGIPVIVVSVVDAPSRGEALGADGYLTKPVALSDLQAALQACASRARRHPHTHQAKQGIGLAIIVEVPSKSTGGSAVCLCGQTSTRPLATG